MHEVKPIEGNVTTLPMWTPCFFLPPHFHFPVASFCDDLESSFTSPCCARLPCGRWSQWAWRARASRSLRPPTLRPANRRSCTSAPETSRPKRCPRVYRAPTRLACESKDRRSRLPPPPPSLRPHRVHDYGTYACAHVPVRALRRVAQKRTIPRERELKHLVAVICMHTLPGTGGHSDCWRSRSVSLVCHRVRSHAGHESLLPASRLLTLHRACTLTKPRASIPKP